MATKTDPYQILWFRFELGSVRVGPSSSSFAGTAVLDPGFPNMGNLGIAGMTIYAQAAYRGVGFTVTLTNGPQITL